MLKIHYITIIIMVKKEKIHSNNVLQLPKMHPVFTAALGDELVICDDLDKVGDYEEGELDLFLSGNVKAKSLFGIVICFEGWIELSWGGSSFKLLPGYMTFMQSGVLGGMIGCSRDVRSLSILCDEKFFKPNLSAAESALFTSEILVKPYCNLTSHGLESAKHLYMHIKDVLEHRDQMFFVRRILTGLLQTFSFLCMSLYHGEMQHNEERFEQSHNDNIFHRFLGLVQTHYAQHYDIKFYADKLCITPKYLSLLVFKASGLHAKDHIENFRLNEAKSLLRSQKHNVNEVSELLSFTSPSHFCRYFKKATGQTPLQFQRG